MKNLKEIKQLLADSIYSCKSDGDDPKVRDWDRRIGVLLSQEQAEQVLELLSGNGVEEGENYDLPISEGGSKELHLKGIPYSPESKLKDYILRVLSEDESHGIKYIYVKYLQNLLSGYVYIEGENELYKFLMDKMNTSTDKESIPNYNVRGWIDSFYYEKYYEQKAQNEQKNN